MSTLGRYLDLPTVATTVLNAVTAHFAAGGVELPSRQSIAAGSPNEIAWDCEQLTVALQGVGWGQAEEAFSQNVQTGTGMSAQGSRHAVILVGLVRCTPTLSSDGNPPTPEQITSGGLAFFKDAGMLSQALVTACADLKNAVAMGRGNVARSGLIDPIGPSGGFVGMVGSIYISLTDLNTVG